jgi:putative methyltransferase (TIGR04325 family)
MPYFRGPYETPGEIPRVAVNPYDDKPWVETAEFSLRHLLDRTASPGFVIDNHLLPVAALIASGSSVGNSVRVLDFGGGMGDNFLQIRAVLSEHWKRSLDYLIVDTPKNCSRGRELMSELAPGLRFDDRIDADKSSKGSQKYNYDVAVFCGSLMYLPSWRDILINVARSTKGYIYIARTPCARSASSFYVEQLIVPAIGPWAGRYIGSIAMEVINPKDIRELLEAQGWRQEFFSTLFCYPPEMSSMGAPHNDIAQAMTLFVRRGEKVNGE